MRSDPGRSSRRRRSVLGVAAAVIAGTLVASAGPAGAAPTAPSGPATPAAETSVAARPTLRQGARGAAVTSLQRRLTALHYDLGTADGVFGGETYHAVVAFQKVHNLGRDGVVGPATWAKLDRPLTLRQRYSHPGTSVEVRLDKQVLILARGGRVTRILDASSGKPSTPTVTGNFTILRRIDGWRTSDLGRLWRPNYFYGGYAIHGYPSVPNYPASHGCVRVSIAAMNRLWGVIGVGMPTHVYYR